MHGFFSFTLSSFFSDFPKYPCVQLLSKFMLLELSGSARYTYFLGYRKCVLLLGASKAFSVLPHQLKWNALKELLEKCLLSEMIPSYCQAEWSIKAAQPGIYPLFSQVYMTTLLYLKELTLSSTDEFKTFLMRLPQNFFLNSSMIQHLWSLDGVFQRRYEQLESSMKTLFRRAQRVVYKLFSLSKRCQKQPHINLPRERWTQQTHYLLIVAMINTLILNSEME